MSTYDVRRRPVGQAPLIGVTGMRRLGADIGHFGRFLHAADVDVYVNHYALGVTRAGGVPVHITRDGPVEALVDRLDGLLVSGGDDVDPRTYGELPARSTTVVDPPRDAFEIALVRAALARDLPFLGICRGSQMLNVALGGTLVGHLSADEGERHSYLGYPGNHRSHRVGFEPGSELERLYGATQVVNSFHHQSVARPGEGLEVSARADDGVVEGVEMPGRAVIGVQWHPEMLDEDPAFSWLVDHAAAAIRSRGAVRADDAEVLASRS